MEFSALNAVTKDNKFFLDVRLSEHRELFRGDLIIEGTKYVVPEEVIELICKLSGISNSMNKILRETSESSWIDTIILMYKYYYSEERLYLLADENNYILEATAKSIKPLLNSEFFQETVKFFSDYEDLTELDSFYYDPSSTSSEILIFNKSSYNYKEGVYKVGILLTNSELGKVSCRIAVQYKNILFYLPPKYCNLSSARYNKTASDSIEAYKLLLLRIIGDMSEQDSWFSIIPEIHYKIEDCKSLPVTYEEYRRATRLLNRISVLSDMDNEEISEIIESLEDEFKDFEKNYPTMEDKKGSYIWRCSAVSDLNVYHLVESLQKVIDSHIFYPEVSSDIRSTIGDFIVLNKLSTELAKKVGGSRGV